MLLRVVHAAPFLGTAPPIGTSRSQYIGVSPLPGFDYTILNTVAMTWGESPITHSKLQRLCWDRGNTTFTVEPAERIAQLLQVPLMQAAFELAEAFSDRDAGGFDSSDRH